jgi:hypothetical protein
MSRAHRVAADRAVPAPAWQAARAADRTEAAVAAGTLGSGSWRSLAAWSLVLERRVVWRRATAGSITRDTRFQMPAEREREIECGTRKVRTARGADGRSRRQRFPLLRRTIVVMPRASFLPRPGVKPQIEGQQNEVFWLLRKPTKRTYTVSAHIPSELRRLLT